MIGKGGRFGRQLWEPAQEVIREPGAEVLVIFSNFRQPAVEDSKASRFRFYFPGRTPAWSMTWYDYDEIDELKEKLQRQLEKRRQRGEKLEAFAAPAGKKLTHQFWGAAWSRHLETYCGYDKRLDRGRSYLRQGKVLNLAVEEGIAAAEVAGSYLYEVEIRVAPLPAAQWAAIKAACAGQVASLLDLLGGQLGDGVMRIITDPDKGLFPKRREIRHQCNCPDDADLCKHQAAVLYAIAVLFDQNPRIFFELRGVDPSELLASGTTSLTEVAADPGGELAGEDLSALFGIDLAVESVAAPPPAAVKSKAPAKKAKTKKSGDPDKKSRTSGKSRPE